MHDATARGCGHATACPYTLANAHYKNKHRPGGARAAWAMALVWSEPEDGSGLVTLGGVGATVE